jgi:hypothetical protein
VLKLTRSLGSWIELRDSKTGAVVAQFRAVPAAAGEDGKVQFEIDAPQHIKINRVSRDDRWREAVPRG